MADTRQDDRQRQKHLMLLVGIAFLVAIGWQILSGGRSAISFHTGEDSFTLTGPESTSATVLYRDITGIKEVSDFDAGTATDGGTSGSVNYGTWENGSLGSYQSFVDTRIQDVIVVTTDDGIYAFNYEDEETTEELARALPDFAAQE